MSGCALLCIHVLAWSARHHCCRYAYVSHPLIASEAQRVIDNNVAMWRQKILADMAAGTAGPEAAERLTTRLGDRATYPVQDDAFHTILQWLASRIADTR